jgi:hypothetical protein
MVSNAEFSTLYSSTHPLQKTAGVGALISLVFALGTLIKWMSDNRVDNGFLGGLDFKENIFNFHPIFMLSGMLLGSLAALLSYRLLPVPKPLSKSMHGLLHTLSISCIVIGLTCVIVGNNYTDHNPYHEYFANLVSMHSIIGVATVCIYGQNYILGLLHFLLPTSLVPVERRKVYMPFHVVLGLLSFVGALMAVETGVMELTAELGCGWAPTSPNTNPANTYHKLSLGCRYGNATGIFALLAALLGMFAMMDLSRFLTHSELTQPLTTDIKF